VKRPIGEKGGSAGFSFLVVNRRLVVRLVRQIGINTYNGVLAFIKKVNYYILSKKEKRKKKI